MACSNGRQPNFAALNRQRHLCSAGRPSGWALAHILVVGFSFFSTKPRHWLGRMCPKWPIFCGAGCKTYLDSKPKSSVLLSFLSSLKDVRPVVKFCHLFLRFSSATSRGRHLRGSRLSQVCLDNSHQSEGYGIGKSRKLLLRIHGSIWIEYLMFPWSVITCQVPLRTRMKAVLSRTQIAV